MSDDFRITRVIVITGNSLAHNPRVLKESSALARVGYDVEVLGAWLDPVAKARDEVLLGSLPFRFTPVVDWTSRNFLTMLGRNACHVRTKLGGSIHRWAGIDNRWQLGHILGLLGQAAVSRHADLYIAHLEQGMQIGADQLARGSRVGVDLEDWFSEDLLPEARKDRPIGLLRRLEQRLLSYGAHATCPSRAMGEALATEFGCFPPRVIYNAFPWSDRDTIQTQVRDRRDLNLPSVHWSSQTLGHGRGLEDLFAALPRLERPVEVHLRGNAMKGLDAWLDQVVPDGWRDRIYVHSLVPSDDLLSRIAEHDIGFAGEMLYCRDRKSVV